MAEEICSDITPFRVLIPYNDLVRAYNLLQQIINHKTSSWSVALFHLVHPIAYQNLLSQNVYNISQRIKTYNHVSY